jgi:hypothetical protein
MAYFCVTPESEHSPKSRSNLVTLFPTINVSIWVYLLASGLSAQFFSKNFSGEPFKNESKQKNKKYVRKSSARRN